MQTIPSTVPEPSAIGSPETRTASFDPSFLTRSTTISHSADRPCSSTGLKMKPAWQEAKVKIKKPDKDLNSKIDAALYDFNYVVTAKKINVAKIKGDILINNLEQVE